MNTQDLINEGSIAIALVVTIVALAVVVIVSGADAIAATGLRDLAILLGGALAGDVLVEADVDVGAQRGVVVGRLGAAL